MQNRLGETLMHMQSTVVGKWLRVCRGSGSQTYSFHLFLLKVVILCTIYVTLKQSVN